MKEPIDVGIIMGSDSDKSKMSGAKKVLEDFKVPFASTIRSAHRTPGDIPEIIASWEKRGCKVIIAGAGGSAQLAGAIASHTILPVIGVPLTTENQSAVNGLDALLATVQMPKGISVATVAINGAANAAYLALRILAINNRLVEHMLNDYRDFLVIETRKKADDLKKEDGWPD